MKNLNRMPTQNGVDDLGSIDFPLLGKEFDGFESVPGSAGQLSRVFHHRLKQHLINSNNAIKANPGKLSHLYNVRAWGNAYDELIGSWNNEESREKVLDRLSATEENFLSPAFMGLGDLIQGDEGHLSGLMEPDLMGLGNVNKESSTRFHITGNKKPTHKRGIFTKIKNASHKVKTASNVDDVRMTGKNAGANIVKNNPYKISQKAAILLALKTNYGRLASRAYWGMDNWYSAKGQGILYDYWQTANSIWERLKNLYVNQLKGDVKILAQAVTTGYYANPSKNKQAGLGDPEIAAIITAAGGVLLPLVAAAGKLFKGKQKTATAAPEQEQINPEETGEESQSETEESAPSITDTLIQVANNVVPNLLPANQSNDDDNESTGDIGMIL